MILHELRTTNSSNEKMGMLNRATPEDKEMFFYAYHPDWMYFQKHLYIRWETIKPFTNIDEAVLNKIKSREITGNYARDVVDNHCEQHGDLVKLICNKNLACGVSDNILNKVFGKKFIPTFKVQLAKAEAISNIQCPIVGQLKYNGTRVITLIGHDGEIIFKTRNGKEFEYPKLKIVLEKAKLANVMLDGELCFGDSKGTDHTKVSGIVNSSIHGTPILDSHDLQYNLFDCMPLKDFTTRYSSNDYITRFTNLRNIISRIDDYRVYLAETKMFDSTEQIEKAFKEVLEQGYEGFILKTWEHLYTFKRSKDWLKIKAIKDCDLLCTGYIPGEGKYQGQIGALTCRGDVEGKQIIVNVGSGLSDLDRSLDISKFLGKIIEIQYNTIIQDKTTGNWSLFLPRFIIEREDK